MALQQSPFSQHYILFGYDNSPNLARDIAIVNELAGCASRNRNDAIPTSASKLDGSGTAMESRRSAPSDVTVSALGVRCRGDGRHTTHRSREGGKLWALVSDAGVSGGPVDFEIASKGKRCQRPRSRRIAAGLMAGYTYCCTASDNESSICPMLYLKGSTPGGTRTPDARLRTPPLYPLSYRGMMR